MAQIHVRTDDTTKKKVQKILDELGLDLSTAVNMYFEQIVLTEGIPFHITKTHMLPNGERWVPRHIMKKWVKEGEEAMKKGKIYDSVDELFADWDAEDECR